MPGSHPPYPVEYRNQLVELVRAGRNPEALAQEFAFVKAYQAQYPIRTLCRILGLSTADIMPGVSASPVPGRRPMSTSWGAFARPMSVVVAPTAPRGYRQSYRRQDFGWDVDALPD